MESFARNYTKLTAPKIGDELYVLGIFKQPELNRKAYKAYMVAEEISFVK